jgi:hypothetical protein
MRLFELLQDCRIWNIDHTLASLPTALMTMAQNRPYRHEQDLLTTVAFESKPKSFHPTSSHAMYDLSYSFCYRFWAANLLFLSA